MQIRGLHRVIYRGARLASRLEAPERSDEVERRDVVARWQQARRDGLCAKAAAKAVGQTCPSNLKASRSTAVRSLWPGSKPPARLTRSSCMSCRRACRSSTAALNAATAHGATSFYSCTDLPGTVEELNPLIDEVAEYLTRQPSPDSPVPSQNC